MKDYVGMLSLACSWKCAISESSLLYRWFMPQKFMQAITSLSWPLRTRVKRLSWTLLFRLQMVGKQHQRSWSWWREWATWYVGSFAFCHILQHTFDMFLVKLLIPCECRTETWENRTVVMMMMHIWNFFVVLRWQLLWTILKLQSLEQISVLAGLKAIVRSTYFHYAYQMPSSIHHCSASSHYQAPVLWLLAVVLCLFLY